MKNYRKIGYLIVMLMFFLSTHLFAQFEVSYHVPSVAAFGYEFNNGLNPEVRLVTNIPVDNFGIEAVLNYGFIRKTDYTFYGGLGISMINGDLGGFVPFGLNIYPFENKSFGFLMEAGPFVVQNANISLSGNVGLRYRFLKE